MKSMRVIYLAIILFSFSAIAQGQVTLSSPAIDADVNSNISVSFNLSTVADAGTVILTFTENGTSIDAGSPHALTLVSSYETAESHSFTLDATDFTNDAAVASVSGGNSLVDGAIYDVKIEYSDGTAYDDTNTGVTYDATAPSGYTVTIDQSTINSGNETSVSFTFSGAEVGATYNYSISDGDGGTTDPTGSDIINTATDQITGIDVSGLNDGTLTLSVTLTDVAGNTGTPATDTETKDVIPPTVQSFAPYNTPDGTYSVSEVLQFQIVWNEPVTATGGTPYIGIDMDVPGTVKALLTGGSGTDTWTFGYTIQIGDKETSPGISTTSPIKLNGSSTSLLDNAGNIADSTFTPGTISGIKVDATQPAVQSVTVPDDGTYIEAQTLDFVATFDKAVDITGTPRIPITLTSGTVYANYSSGTGTTAITFTYTVGSDDLDLDDGITLATVIDLNGGTIKEKNNVASNSLIGVNPLPSTTGILIDAIEPSVESITMPSNSYYKLGEVVTVTLDFNEIVYVDNTSGNPTIDLNFGSGTVKAGYNVGSGSQSLDFTYTISSTDLDLDGFNTGTTITLTSCTIKDGATNGAVQTFTAGNTTSIIDGVVPNLTSVSIASNNLNSSGTYAKEGDQITLSFTGSETLTAKPTVTIAGNAIASGSVTNPSGNDWQAVYTMGALDAEGIVSFSIDFTDLAGNTNTTVTSTSNSSSVTYYRTKPTLSSVSIVSNHTNSDSANVGDLITITFSSARELDNVTATILGNVATVNNLGDLYNWTATYTTQSDDVEGQIPFTISFTDMPENAGDPVSATTDGSSVIFDKTPPQLNSVTIESDNTNSAYVGDGGTVILSITGSEGLENSPVVTINGHSAIVSKVAGSSINWKASYVMGSAGADADGAVAFTVDFVDFSGNSGVQVTDITGTTDGSSVILDQTPPSLLTVSIISNNSNNTSFAKPGDEVTIDFTSDDDIENVSATIGVEAKSMAVSSSSATNWTAEYTLPSTGVTEGVLPMSISFKDFAGNQVTHNTGTTDGSSVTFDKTAPDTASAPDLISDYGISSTDNITYDDTPRFFGTAEAFTTVKLYSNVNGLIGTVTASDTSTYEVNSSILNEGNHIITATVTDGPGNVSPVSSSTTITIDKTPPAQPGTPDMDAGSDTGIENDDDITSDNTPSFAGSSETNCRIRIYSGTTYLGTTDADIFGVWTFTAPPLSPGIHKIAVTSTDPAGNISVDASDTLEINIDQTPPVPPAQPVLDSGSDTGNAGDNYTSDNTPTINGTIVLQEAGAAISLFSSVNGMVGSGTAGAGGDWTITASELSSGDHMIYVSATDSAGNTGAFSDTLYLTIDRTAPDSPSKPDLDSDPAYDSGTSQDDDITNAGTLRFNGTAEVDGLEVKLYSGATLLGDAIASGSPATWSIQTSSLTGGTYSITATATDGAGNTSVSSDALTVTVDVTPPIAPAKPDMDALSDTGPSSVDNITSDNTPTFSGTAEVGSIITIYSGATAIGDTVAVGGSWTKTILAPLSDGVHQIKATATDAAGNTGSASNILEVTIDTSAPADPGAPDLVDGSDTGTSDSDNITSDHTPSLKGATENSAVIHLYSDLDGAIGTGNADGTGAWSAVTSSLSDGIHNITFTATDAAGNVSGRSDTLLLTIDTSAPDKPIAPDLHPDSDSGTSSSDDNTNDDTPVFSGTAEKGAIVRLYNGAVMVAEGLADATTGAWSLTSSQLNEGLRNLSVTATDLSGNTSVNSDALMITIDLSAPAAPAKPDLDTGSDTGSSSIDDITNDDTPTFNGTAEVDAIVKLYSGAVEIGETVATGGIWTITPATALADGVHPVTVTATDAAGNTSGASSVLDITIDTAEPVTPGEPDLTDGSDTGISNSDDNTNDATPTFTGTAEEGAAIQLYSDQEGLVGTGVADGAGIWTITSGSLSSALHAITVVATDTAGNVSDSSPALNVTIDTDLPSQPAAPDLDVLSDNGAFSTDDITNDTTPLITGQAEANAYVDVYIDNVLDTTLQTDPAGQYSYTFGALADGSHSIRVVCKDPAGNASVTSNNLQLTVDTALPTLSSVTLASNNARTYLAKAGDKVTLSFNSSESVQQPTVDIDGKSVAITGGPTVWTATRTLDGTETEGSLDFSIQYTDIAGNAGVIQTATTDASEVLFDRTVPNLTSIGIASDHINADKARVGSEINIVFTSTETIENVGVKINGKVAPVDTISANNWQATGYLATDDPEGEVAFTIDYKDLAGNAGVQKTATTDASAVNFDKTTPSYSQVSIYSDNSNPAYAVDGDLVSLEFVTSEAVETPEIFINGLVPDAITGGPVSWLATRTITAGENEGTIPFTINISDLAGNTPTTKFTTTDGTAVVFDDSNPGISSVRVASGVYKVGDVITLLIRSDDVTYTGITVEVNGKPQVLVNNMNNNYTIDYLVEEGDAELHEAGSIPVDIVLQDPAGLTTSSTEATSTEGTVTIDSRTPQISAFSTDAEETGNLIIGDSIIFTLVPVTAEAGLHIQPVSYNGAALNWITADGTAYTAVYVVQEGDPEQTAPLQPAQVILSDDAGNADTTVYTGIGKKIYSAYPSAKITGSTSKCDYGQTVPITFQFTGRKPFTFSYSNGTDTIGPIVRDGLTYTINAVEGTFSIVNLIDSTGNFVTEALENATIDVVPLPVVTTDYFNSPYNVESPADELSQYVVQEDKRNGIFSAAEGIGYSNGAYYIYPGNIPADLLDKDIEIIYTYTDGNTGCFTKDTNTVFVSSTPVRIVGLQSVYCEDNDPVTIGGNLPAQHSGRFDVFDADANLVTSGWVQTDSITLTLDPRDFPAGDYTMKYTAIKLPEYTETNFSSTREFSIEAIRTDIQITGLSDEYCFDDLSSSIPVRVNFEPGPGDIGNFFGSDVFTVIPGEHTARFELGDARADSVYTLNYIYKSVNGCIADTASRTVRINPLPELAFELDNNYNYAQNSIQLSGTPDDPKYNFTGEGVSNNILYTSAARINSDIIITFSGSDEKGCYNEVIDTTIIYRANETIAGITTDGVYCYESRVLDISCTPNISDTITGTFRSKRNALEPDGKNRARYYFNRIGSGADTVYFDYEVLGTSYTVEKAVFIDSIGEVSITSSTADFDYCHSEPLVQLTGNQNYTLGGQGEFEYVGSSGEAEITRSSTTAIYPVNEVPGTYSIRYTYTSSRGCSSETSHVINIFPEPVTDFSQPVSCPDVTTPVPFANLTTFSGDASKLSWKWSFEGGLPVTEKNPVYTFQSNGVKQVTLTATTDKGCAVSKSKEYTIGNFALADFKWDNECNTGEQVTLTSTSTGGVPENAGYTWKVEGVVIPGDRSAVHEFSDIGAYDIRLLYTSDAGCTDSVTKTLVIQPYIRITEEYADHTYLEDFESGNELYTWQTRGLTEKDTTRWNLGVPDGEVINMAASGSHSWYTRLTDRTEVENSEVVSPCFDLSGLEKPMIKMNIWSSSEFKRDGAVMQYSTDYGNTWDNLGAVNEGISWFNSENIQSQPGGVTQFEGWNEVRMGEWNSARHSLDFLKDESIVRFRIAYAADGGGVEDVDGFAFDDVWIGERQQNVLTEYFTNSNVSGSFEANDRMTAYEDFRAADLIPIHYHTGSPAGDPLFSDYEEGPSARVFYYGVSSVPEVLSNGFIRSGLDDEAFGLFEQEVDVESLRDPLVSIDLSVSRSSAAVTITALADLSGENLVLYAAVVKDSIEVDGVYHYNVLRKFLPDPAGTVLSTGGFTDGETIAESVPVSLGSSSMYTGSRLVVFVQDINSKHIYQSVWADLSGLTSLAPVSIDDMVDIYPNPATEHLFIDCEYEIRRLVITDMTGRVVRIMEPDQSRLGISLDEYKYGLYMIKGITDHGEFNKKFIKQ